MSSEPFIGEKPDNPPFNQWLVSGDTVWANFYRTDTGYLIRFPDLADFFVSMDGYSIRSYPGKDVSEQTVEHLYLNQVLPLALSRQSRLVFHAGAVELDQKAIAFLGESGSGKSTLTASFATNGYPFLTDDGLQLEFVDGIYKALPSHPSIRLWDDSRMRLLTGETVVAPPVDYTPKARLLAGNEVVFCDRSLELGPMYILGNDHSDLVCFESVSGKSAIMELLRHSFFLDVDEKQLLATHFKQLSELIKYRSIFNVSYPRKFARLQEVRDALISHARKHRE